MAGRLRPAAEQLDGLKNISPQQLFKALQKASAKKAGYIDVADNYLKGLMMGIDEEGKRQRKKELDEEERKMIRQKQREGLKNLNLYWLNQMVDTRRTTA